MQQRGGESGQHGAAQPVEMTHFSSTARTDPRTHILQGGEQQLPMQDPSLADVAEAASPISSRPPAVGHLSAAGNFEEFLPAGGVGGSVAHHDDEDALAGDEADREGGVGGGVAGGNRWPREETLALLKIRSEMDAVFRDATLKGPLWEDVSRKLAELGYKRSAKKCKEKFENVHKYYKRTKEGRAGRQDGKSYRFFSQLEALHSTNVSTSPSILNPTSVAINTTTTTATNLPVLAPLSVSTGIGVANPMPLSSVRMPPPHTMPTTRAHAQVQAPPSSIGALLPDLGAAGMASAVFSGSATQAAVPSSAPTGGISFSSDSSSTYSSSDGFDDDDDDEMELEGDLKGNQANTRDRKRKRASSGLRSDSSQKRMMEFFEGLMKQVMQKQEAMQQRFLEAIEKRDQDRMIREEAWKRQEMARLTREQEIMVQERAMSASRNAAVIAFIQKITGQTIPLPSAIMIPAAPLPPPPPQPPVVISQPPSAAAPIQSSSSQHHYQKPKEPHQAQQLQQQQIQLQPQLQEKQGASPPQGAEVVIAVPEQQIPQQEINTGGGNLESTSSRWPKTEVLALIKLRSGLESRYQEAGPKGPLWEEISARMQRMGYKRSAKRCKEKWENINKYFKKVKESKKKRPEDAKTCPYFHQLNELYRKKVLSGSSSSGNGGDASTSGAGIMKSGLEQLQHQQQSEMLEYPKAQENKNGGDTDLRTSNGKRSDAEGPKTPEDIVKEQHQQNQRQQMMTIDYDKIQEPEGDNLDQAEDEENYEDDDDDDNDDDEDDVDEETDEEMKMAYKIQFQRQNTGSSNEGGNGASSFLAMVQ